MSKQNCWEFKNCGREAGGAKTGELGECPAATLKTANSFCGGKNGGRACVYISGTFCGGAIQGTHKDKEKKCTECDFYKILKKDHGIEFSVLRFQEHVK